MHMIAAKAVALREAAQPEFKEYARQVVRNAKALADELMAQGLKLVTDGTDNHLMLIDLRSKGITGKDAENTLIKADITINKNMVPFDDKSPFVTSGMRVGTAAITTRGMKENDMERVVELIDTVLMNINNEEAINDVGNQVNEWMKSFPLYTGTGEEVPR